MKLELVLLQETLVVLCDVAECSNGALVQALSYCPRYQVDIVV